MNSMAKIVSEVKNMIVSRRVVGAGLTIVGLAVTVGATMDAFTTPLPYVGFSLMQFAGALTLLMGVAILAGRRFDPLGIRAAAE
ncbi:uncharacterized protein METZ01_LOCUS380061 [marine metagenome]|jgi:hypothetical protein|uniref:Uncharacterized protein n=1 Tax=marine metagenome TaxID=408172 RepID=A0A382TZS8_9ZZZZ